MGLDLPIQLDFDLGAKYKFLKMSGHVTFAGDLVFTKMLSGEFSKTRFTFPFDLQPILSLNTLKQYSSMKREDVEYLVLGCLPSLLVELKISKV